MNDRFSEYLVFVDESGDHGLHPIDPDYPIFVLAFCIIRKEDYVDILTPAVQRFKMKYFGHDDVILHERDIRKDQGAFAFLKTSVKKQEFLDELTAIVTDTPFTLICSVICKDHFRLKYVEPSNPYHIALKFGLERIFYFLRDHEMADKNTYVLVEKRGKREDAELELEFRRVCNGRNYLNEPLPFDITFVDKKSNSVGLQIADLIARPVGMSLLRPDQNNRAFAAIKQKFYKSKTGKLMGWGLKCFP